MNVNEEKIRLLHAVYCDMVGALPLTLDRIYWWGVWAGYGWGEEELKLVIRHIQAGIKNGKRFPGALRWSNLIQKSEMFGEEIILAKAEKRNARPAPSAKEAFIHQRIPITGPLVEKCTAVPIGRVIEAMRAEVNKRPV